jgi:hypothetical protein
MIKAIELIVVVTLMVFSFVIGVKYSDSVKSHAGWLFEAKEDEVDLPDLTNESATDGATVYDNGAIDNGDQMPQEPMDNVSAPMDNSVETPAPAEVRSPKSKTSAASAKN